MAKINRAPLDRARKIMKPYWRLTLAYLAFGLAWIFLSDQLGAFLAGGDVTTLTHLQTLKGWIFVAASSLFIFTLTRQAFRALEREQRERLSMFRKTIEGSHHILLNYLNQMQVVTMEAEKCATFDPATLGLAQEVSEEASAALRRLGEAKILTSEHLDAILYPAKNESPRPEG